MNDLIILARQHGWHLPTAAPRVVRLATAAYQDPADPTPWWPLLRPAGGWTLAATAPGESDGATKVEVGELTLSETPPSSDRHGTPRLTALLDGMRIVGWPLELFAIRAGQPFSAAVPLAVLTVGEVERRSYSRVLRPRDRAADFDMRAAGPASYAGTGGLEGPAALKGKGKELLIGRHRHFEPTYLGIDATNGCHLFSVSQGLPMGGYREVRSRGRRWTEVTGTPASGQWSQDATRGLAWVGPGDVGTITCAADGVVDGSGALIETAAAVGAWLARHSGALGAAEIDAVAAAGVGAGLPVQMWLAAGDTTPLRSALDDLTRAVRANWYFGPLGLLTFALRGRPAAGSAASATLRAGIDFVQAVTEPRVTGVPARRVRLRHSHNAKVLTASEILAEVPPEERAALMAEWLDEVTPDDPAITAACPIPREVTDDTLLATASAAAVEAVGRRDDAFSPPGRYRLPMRRLPTERIGQVVRVIDPSHPVFVGGPVARVVEVQVDLAGVDNALVVIPEGTV
ncbi:hypothetical protein [Roseomonas genomospecies 6]|uniref:Uncharacterized protein n=1 Tax=Roseomonas genomospecies 6 TaxID=214106 RepID=A0A9W7KQZ2_9PROT|nr:hypothetical protein [Roseomonas genomospecies 6]KAA0678070.1 hypothetical protein DS843_21035 [Roseomonas genomospecies 6]